MSNMSYCRFQNTSGDLDTCANALEAVFACDTADGDGALSRDELRAAERLIETCVRILSLVADRTGMEFEDIVQNTAKVHEHLEIANGEYAEALKEDQDHEDE